jgi:hypothetical protein
MDGTDGSTTFTDSAQGRTITANGTAQVDTAEWKFNGASGLFDGNSDYLSLADNDDWAFGTGDFTVECWVRFNTLQNSGFMGQRVDGTHQWNFGYNHTSTWLIFKSEDGAGTGTYRCGWTPSVDTWYHVAFCRYGSTAVMMIDGVEQATTQVNAFGTIANLAASLVIGYHADLGYHDGWIDELRIVKGTAKYTGGNVDVPWIPYLGRSTNYNITANRGQVLMISGEGADGATTIIDETGKTVTANGTAQIDTAQYKFGQSSVLLDGNSDYLSLADSLDWYFGDQNFTIDCWIRPNAIADNDTIWSQYVDGTNRAYLKFNGTTQLQFRVEPIGGTDLEVNGTHGMSTGNWYHVAVVRNGSAWNLYVDGTSIGSGSDSNAYPDLAASFLIGYASGLDYFNGWVDDFRITKGKALWTAAFTPPLQTTALINGETDEEYKLKAMIINDDVGVASRWLNLNNDTAGNYGRQELMGSAAVVSAWRGTGETRMYIEDGSSNTDSLLISQVLIHAKSGYARTHVCTNADRISGSSVNQVALNGSVWNNSSGHVASILVNGGATNGLGLGTKLLLYRKVE